MTIKLVLLKSNERVIADVREATHPNIKDQVVGYYFNKPCITFIENKDHYLDNEDEDYSHEGNLEFEDDSVAESTVDSDDNDINIQLLPWMPLSADDEIPVSLDWVVSMVEPVDGLRKLFTEKVLEGTNGQDNSANKSVGFGLTN
tara:strand:+ start:66 stop:500 length:435 start_codon:yes stop_codon:yes gene_type:complete